MKKREFTKLWKKISRKVNKYWQKHDWEEKENFEAGLKILVRQIANHTKTPFDEIAPHTHAVMDEFIIKTEEVPEDMRTTDAMIFMLCGLYIKKIGML